MSLVMYQARSAMAGLLLQAGRFGVCNLNSSLQKRSGVVVLVVVSGREVQIQQRSRCNGPIFQLDLPWTAFKLLRTISTQFITQLIVRSQSVFGMSSWHVQLDIGNQRFLDASPTGAKKEREVQTRSGACPLGRQGRRGCHEPDRGFTPGPRKLQGAQQC